MDVGYTKDQLKAILQVINDEASARKSMEEELLNIQITNMDRLKGVYLDHLAYEEKAKLDKERTINERLVKMGLNAAAVVAKGSLEERLKALDEEEKNALKGKKGGAAAKIKAEYAAKREEQKKLEAEIDKVNAARKKEEEKYNKKKIKDLKSMASSEFSTLGDVIFKDKESAIQNLMAEKGLSREDAETAVKGQRAQVLAEQGQKLIEDFAKQLQGRIDEIASAQTSIDTRLQGAKQKTILGSYWKQMSHDIVKNVSFSPFIKQADVVTSLKTLVGKGIAFNVEQRAFLDTISAKIADTFNATDATLVKLVRIQQADTTAARLGMESALTAFLNNMYETTEYMTEAAEGIRASLYEASALMGAKEATAFEYQVQKWMGSLYSVGFSNTSGLADALGKLASGDISGINDGGYGNLLIMAANRANLSIAEILADGLDDSETNQLMKAMVEYLGDIYKETKNSKVVAQQFANVYGLTASDLKAAANLAGSTNVISHNAMTYNSMLTQLNNMANTMWMRTSTGEMMNNLFDNLKYGIANSMANNPALYATYTIASMLDSTVGGIAIPAFSVMGNMVDLETTVANLMRVGALAGGLLGGIGTMLGGLGTGGGFSGSGMLRAFGVNGGLNTTSRGNAAGLLTTASGMTTSNSGYVGNSDSSDVQNKTMTDANDDADAQLEEKIEEDNETKLSTVDEHIVQIYGLLNDVINGWGSIRVKNINSDIGGIGG